MLQVVFTGTVETKLYSIMELLDLGGDGELLEERLELVLHFQ
jgi:hypothetical protein